MKPDELINEFKQARNESVFYDNQWLREWQKKPRFYLTQRGGGNQKSDTQYWTYSHPGANIYSNNFRNRETYVKTKKKKVEKSDYEYPIEIEYAVGYVEDTHTAKDTHKPVIVKVNPQYFW